jgi:hypothetical protein
MSSAELIGLEVQQSTGASGPVGQRIAGVSLDAAAGVSFSQEAAVARSRAVQLDDIVNAFLIGRDGPSFSPLQSRALPRRGS